MKKICTFMFSLFLICSVSFPVSAADEYANANDLYQAWVDHMPDYISGVWSIDGSQDNLTFGIVESADAEAVKAEILSLVKDDSGISFASQKYSHNELMKINDELLPYFPDSEHDLDYGMISMGVHDMENVIELEILEERRNDPVTIAFVREITEKYGDAIRVTYSHGYIMHTVLEQKIPGNVITESSPAVWLGFVAVLFVFLSSVLWVVKKRQSAVVLQTNSGEAVSASGLPTAKEVETVIRNTAESVPDSLEQRIFQSIDPIN